MKHLWRCARGRRDEQNLRIADGVRITREWRRRRCGSVHHV